MFPGMLGLDVARDMTRAIDEMQCDRLIIDLLGNTGGGIGCLRLMSLLCDDRRGVGYSLGRDVLKSGRTKEQLPVFDRIPASKSGVLPLFVKFARVDRSVAVSPTQDHAAVIESIAGLLAHLDAADPGGTVPLRLWCGWAARRAIEQAFVRQIANRALPSR